MFPPSFFDQLEDRLNLAVYDTNREYELAQIMTLTGAANFAETLKTRIETARQRIVASTTKADGALVTLMSAADTADQIAETLTAEADTLTAMVGQFSNGGPA